MWRNGLAGVGYQDAFWATQLAKSFVYLGIEGHFVFKYQPGTTGPPADFGHY